MTEPPRPPGDGNPHDPTAPVNPYGGNDPTSGPSYGSPQPPTYGSPPPSSGAGGYGPPPSSGGGVYGAPPSSGAGGYGPPPSSGGTYGAPGSGAGGYGAPQGGQYGAPQGGHPQGGHPQGGQYGAPQGGQYGAPQGGQYGQPGGYGQPAYGGYGGGNPDDKTWLMVAHFGGAGLAFLSLGTFGWIAPLIAMLVQGPKSPAVRQQAVNALNFQILWAVVAVAIWLVSSCLSLILIGLLGFFLLIVPFAMGTIFGIVAGAKASNGEAYSYPTAPNWVK